ncbi:MAG: FAD-dependent oxidoreductase [Kiritimatiellae bacterium]|nr:FAD-dependent oxidoreductase [Kiritimatiellia bacterium]MDD5522628.1 FAD-dependent oxidoreductase [Kiritimatiellia bacterium]
MKTAKQVSFCFKNAAELGSEIRRLKLDIPFDKNISLIGRKFKLGNKVVPNRLAVQPMEGADALPFDSAQGKPDGSPGKLTFRRYTRFAQGGFGLICVEATAVMAEARSSSSQLYLHKQNVEKFSQLVKAIRKAAFDSCRHKVTIIIQLTHPGRYCRPEGTPRPFITHHNPVLDRIHNISAKYPVVTDDDLDRLQDRFVTAAQLAFEAGFDGIDIKSCHRNLLAELLGSFTRKGKYGGSFENRTRFLRETITRIKENVPGLMLATRMSAYDAIPHPYGFGVDRKDPRKFDLSEPIKLARMLKKCGVSILNVSMDNPVATSSSDKSSDVMTDDASIPGEHPLVNLNRTMNITRKIQKSVPDLPVIGRGFSWFRQFMPYVAAGAIKNGSVAIVGIGRGALAYPDMAKDIIRSGSLDPVRCCITCSACMQILRDGGNAGCVIRDSEIYGLEYRQRRQFAPDSLKTEARRCHYCESATCTAGCPAHIDVPGFIKAYAEDNIDEAFKIIRRSNVLPEVCSHLCPTWLMCEGACIESAISQNPIRIKDIQYAVCWMARDRGLVGTKIPKKSSGKTVAIIGAGPAGVSCAVKLLEAGHNVTIFERENQAGGTPQTVIRSGRISGVKEEVDAVLRPGIQAGRLVIKYGWELGKNITLPNLRKEFDAVLLASGLWKELSIGKADGVIDALTFLTKVKRGEIISVPKKVAILSGGDSAMDAAVTAKELGAVDLYVVYNGSLSEMHWHMDDAWFRTSGANLLSLTKPVRYEVSKKGKLTGLKTCRTEYGLPDSNGTRKLKIVPGSESVLKVDMIIEAMGLGIANDLKKTLQGIRFNEHNLIKTTGNDSFATGLNKVFAAGGLINGGASVVHCIVDGMKAAAQIDHFLKHRK